jgi:hypothetical protein
VALYLYSLSGPSWPVLGPLVVRIYSQKGKSGLNYIFRNFCNLIITIIKIIKIIMMIIATTVIMKYFEYSRVLCHKVQYWYVEVKLQAFLTYGLGKEPLSIQELTKSLSELSSWTLSGHRSYFPFPCISQKENT